MRQALARERKLLVQAVSLARTTQEPLAVGQGTAVAIAESILGDDVTDARAVYLAAEFSGMDLYFQGVYTVPQECDSDSPVCLALFRIEAMEGRGVRPDVADKIRGWKCTHVNCTKVCQVNPCEGWRLGAKVEVSSYSPPRFQGGQ